jgi:hypothetical protein
VPPGAFSARVPWGATASPWWPALAGPAGILGAGAVGNEPHHVGISRDGRTLALGGLLSFLRSQAQVFFFDVTKPRYPKFIGSNNPSNASITDDFASLSTGGFLATFMGGPGGAHPGRVVEYGANLNVVQTLPTPTDDTDHPFNPHGISIDEANNLMVTADYVCPVSTLHIGGVEWEYPGLGSRESFHHPHHRRR